MIFKIIGLMLFITGFAFLFKKIITNWECGDFTRLDVIITTILFVLSVVLLY